MDTKQKSPDSTIIMRVRQILSERHPPQEADRLLKVLESPIIIQRIQMLGEDQIPQEVLDRFLKTPQEKDIFLTVVDPDQWPASMQPFRKWIEENVPPEYWAASEEEE